MRGISAAPAVQNRPFYVSAVMGVLLRIAPERGSIGYSNSEFNMVEFGKLKNSRDFENCGGVGKAGSG